MPIVDENILWLEYDGARYTSEATRALDSLMAGCEPHAMALDIHGDLAVTMRGTPVAVLLLDKDDSVTRSEVRFAPFGTSIRTIKSTLDKFKGRTVRYRAT